MKVTIAIVVYNRLFNIEHWLKCWAKCNQENAEVVVIHNFDEVAPDYLNLCFEHGVGYIRRKNVGFDIGAFQDVCRNRLEKFPKWERLLWMTDDTFPMSYDFVDQFSRGMRPGVGVVAMEISKYVTRHIRTTGFMIDRVTAEQLKFPADPIITKQHCYLFEHRDKKNIFHNQVIKMGLSVEWAAERSVSPLWDTGYHRRLNRRDEHEAKFGEYKTNDKVLFICPIYKSYPAIIASLIMQTHKNWRLLLVHDGPDTTKIEQDLPYDERVTFMATKKRGGCWGHYIRSVMLAEYYNEADYIVVTNPDNYYCPPFISEFLKGFERHPSAVAMYGEQIVHSYTNWKVMNCSLNIGFLDCGGVMVRSIVAKEVPWEDISSHSADWYWFSDIIEKYGEQGFKKIPGCMFIHN